MASSTLPVATTVRVQDSIFQVPSIRRPSSMVAPSRADDSATSSLRLVVAQRRVSHTAQAPSSRLLALAGSAGSHGRGRISRRGMDHVGGSLRGTRSGNFGQSIGLAEATPDADGYCAMSFDELVVHFQYDADDVVIFSRLGEVDEDRVEGIYGMLLAANMFWQGTKGGTISVEPDSASPSSPTAAPRPYQRRRVPRLAFRLHRHCRALDRPARHRQRRRAAACGRRRAAARAARSRRRIHDPRLKPQAGDAVASLEISAFRSAQGNRLTLDQAQHPTGVIKAELPFGDRVVNYFNPAMPATRTAQQQQDNSRLQDELPHGADQGRRRAHRQPGSAFRRPAAGLAEQRQADEREDGEAGAGEGPAVPQGGRGPDRAQYRRVPAPHHAAELHQHLPGRHQSRFHASARHRRRQRDTACAVPARGAAGSAFRHAHARRDGHAEHRCARHCQVRAAEAERLPRTASRPCPICAEPATPARCARTRAVSSTGCLSKLSTTTAQGHPLSTEPPQFRGLAQETLLAISRNGELLSEMRYDPEGWQEFNNELLEGITKLNRLEVALGQLGGPSAPITQEGEDLLQSPDGRGAAPARICCSPRSASSTTSSRTTRSARRRSTTATCCGPTLPARSSTGRSPAPRTRRPSPD